MDLSHIPHHLPIDLASFGFTQREKSANGSPVKNRCGRDFFYYALHFFYPNIFSPTALNPVEIERQHIFGTPMPATLVWTGLPFKNIPNLFKEKNLMLTINSLLVRSYWSFMRAMLFQKPKQFDQALNDVRSTVDAGNAVGIDVSIRLGGLVDHVMFIYGYDENNLYVFDTHQVSGLAYEKITPLDDTRNIMRLPLNVIRGRWTRWNRVWILSKIPSANS